MAKQDKGKEQDKGVKDVEKVKRDKANETYNNIGLAHKITPSHDCKDGNCPFHGNLRIRGKIRQGVVVSTKSNKTAVVEWTYLKKVPKYKRYMKSRSRVMVHNPSCVNAKVGNTVKIGECRPISKTKSFVIYDVLN